MKKDRLVFLLLAVVYGVGFSVFYLRYVPLVRPFQAALVPLLILAFSLSVLREEWGLLFFVFTFPLINNLPYFFGISESIPHAPTALVLFLAFFFGWLVRRIFQKGDAVPAPKILKPITLFSLVVVASAVITYLRYANFSPLRQGRFYEIITNTIGVSAGGAMMSVVFFALNYLTGLAFFFIFISTPRSKATLNRIMYAFCLSALTALCFGLYQHLVNLNFGNNPRSIYAGMINGTFKDALSFGTFISIATPLILCTFFYFHWKGKLLAFVIVALSFYLILFAGSKSGMISFVFSLITLVILGMAKVGRLLAAKTLPIKRALSFVGGFFLFIIILTGAWMTLKVDFNKAATLKRLTFFIKYGHSDSSPYTRTANWKIASYMISDFPLTGVGIGGYIIEAPNYSREHTTKYIISESAENYFLQVGSELGIVGLLLVIWISWEIARQTWLANKRIQDSDKNKYMLMGAMAGLAAYLLNIQAHSYIGSYEIKYTFWFFAGLIFNLGRISKPADNAIYSSKAFKISSLVIIILYSGVHLLNSTHALSLKSRTAQLSIKQDFGFYQPEKTNDGRRFRWSGKIAAFTIKIKNPVLELPILASHPDILHSPVKASVFIVKDFFKEKRLLGKIILNRNIWQTYEFHVPEGVGQEVILLFEVSRTWNPSKVLGTPDQRNLGVAIGDIGFKD